MTPARSAWGRIGCQASAVCRCLSEQSPTLDALIRAGHSESQAIQIAVGVVKRWAAGLGNVTAKTRAKAAAALAEWEAKKAASHAS